MPSRKNSQITGCCGCIVFMFVLFFIFSGGFFSFEVFPFLSFLILPAAWVGLVFLACLFISLSKVKRWSIVNTKFKTAAFISIFFILGTFLILHATGMPAGVAPWVHLALVTGILVATGLMLPRRSYQQGFTGWVTLIAIAVGLSWIHVPATFLVVPWLYFRTTVPLTSIVFRMSNLAGRIVSRINRYGFYIVLAIHVVFTIDVLPWALVGVAWHLVVGRARLLIWRKNRRANMFRGLLDKARKMTTLVARQEFLCKQVDTPEYKTFTHNQKEQLQSLLASVQEEVEVVKVKVLSELDRCEGLLGSGHYQAAIDALGTCKSIVGTLGDGPVSSRHVSLHARVQDALIREKLVPVQDMIDSGRLVDAANVIVAARNEAKRVGVNDTVAGDLLGMVERKGKEIADSATIMARSGDVSGAQRLLGKLDPLARIITSLGPYAQGGHLAVKQARDDKMSTMIREKASKARILAGTSFDAGIRASWAAWQESQQHKLASVASTIETETRALVDEKLATMLGHVDDAMSKADFPGAEALLADIATKITAWKALPAQVAAVSSRLENVKHLNGLFQLFEMSTSKRMKLNDVAAVLEIPRDQLVKKLVQWRKLIPNISIDGDDLFVGTGENMSDLIALLDKEFAEWDLASLEKYEKLKPPGR